MPAVTRSVRGSKATPRRRAQTAMTSVVAGSLVAIGIVVLAGSAAAVGARGRSAASTAGRAHAGAAAKLRVVSLRYGKVRPTGAARAYSALQVTVLPPRSQVVTSVRYQQLDPPHGAAIADAGCGLPGKKPGRVETLTLPIKLRAGRHRFTVTASSSPCGRPGSPQTATRTLSVVA